MQSMHVKSRRQQVHIMLQEMRPQCEQDRECWWNFTVCGRAMMWVGLRGRQTQSVSYEKISSLCSHIADNFHLCICNFKNKYLCNNVVKTDVLTLFPSSQRVTMTIIDDCCSQTILQKSLTVSSLGPTTHTEYVYTQPCTLCINQKRTAMQVYWLSV